MYQIQAIKKKRRAKSNKQTKQKKRKKRKIEPNLRYIYDLYGPVP